MFNSFQSMFMSLNEPISIFFGKNLPSTPLPIKFDRYVHWLETKLLVTAKTELTTLDGIIDQISNRITSLKDISTLCRTSMIVHNSTQANRIYKLYDQVDTIVEPYSTGRLFLSAGNCAITSLLPDLDNLTDMIYQTKMKLKSIEEMASSKKNDVVKFKGSKLSSSHRSENKKAIELSSIRTEVKAINSLLDELNEEIKQKSIILSYFGQIKQLVHIPLQLLSFRLRSLPSLNDASLLIEHEHEEYKKITAFYDTVRQVEVLVMAARTAKEMTEIELLVGELLEPLQQYLDQEEIYHLLHHTYTTSIDSNGSSSSSSNKEEGEEGGAAEPAAWLYRLRHFAQLPLTDILRLSASSEQGRAFISDASELQALLNSIDDKADPLWKNVSISVVCGLRGVDAELVGAYSQDWAERVRTLETVQKSPEFRSAYEQLTSGRIAYERASSKYEHAVSNFNSIVAVHREANLQLNQLKERFIEIALNEVSEEIEFVA